MEAFRMKTPVLRNEQPAYTVRRCRLTVSAPVLELVRAYGFSAN
jgi:hypothetical protein